MDDSNVLHELIEKRRQELGGDGRPVSFAWIAERSGVPVASVHAIASRPPKSLTPGVKSRLAAIAQALDVDPEELENAAIRSMGYRAVEHTYKELDEDQEVLIGAYDALDEDERRQVVEFARFLRDRRL